ncbi:MAG: CRISPR-associated helicase Cas3' [Defluviitaleaceae bacterium]|nr:CRISPR-associated helicase Cas3' [Defluviitaleaceae bacterium]
MNKKYIARTNKNKDGTLPDREELREQPLIEHLENVEKNAVHFGAKIGVEELCKIVAMYHDIGKSTVGFQDYLAGKTKKHEGGHSIYGAKLVYNELTKNDIGIAEIIANIILGHHGSLVDNIDHQGENVILDKLEKELNEQIEIKNLNINFDIEKAKQELKCFLEKFEKNEKIFMVSFLIKYIFSCLVDADRLDAYHFATNTVYSETKPNWNLYINKLEEHLKSKENSNDIGKIRKQISEDAKKSSKKSKGTYKLEVETGGGKTLASLRFAMEHAKIHNMDRVIYVIPFLSIIDQTAMELKELLGEDVVLEHTSNVIFEDEKTEEQKEKAYRLQTERWDSSVVITTLVQFLESGFSARGTNLRKLHNMSNSVLIFDEVQSMPIKCYHLFNGFINFLVKSCESTVLLCTATQPHLDKVDKPVILSMSESITTVTMPKRTDIKNCIKQDEYRINEVSNFIKEKFNTSLLAIFNTKKAALEVYLSLKEHCEKENIKIIHLSTNMCSSHRKKNIAHMREKLKNKEKIICISTQLIEAGIDISFECVVRSIAGLDSIHQAAGRCNRHGEYREPKEVYVINPDFENLDMLPDIKIGADVTKRVFRENGYIDDYYKYYLYKQKDKMDYNTTLDKQSPITIYNLLTTNNRGVTSYRDKKSNEQRHIFLKHAIKTASDEFFVIEKGQETIVIIYDESQSLLDEYDKLKEYEIKEKVRIIKKLGAYSIGIYPHQLKTLGEHIKEINGIKRLSKSYYNEEFGFDPNGKLELLVF